VGKKKWCFGREDVICMTKDCKYMSECVQVVWERKMARLVDRGREEGSGSLTRLKTKLKKEERSSRRKRPTPTR